MKCFFIKRISTEITIIGLIVALTACGQKADTSPSVEEVSELAQETSSIEKESAATEEKAEPSEEKDPCEVNGHTWMQPAQNQKPAPYVEKPRESL